MTYIDKEIAIKIAVKNARCKNQFDAIELVEAMEDIPIADVVEVKRGEWKRKGQDIYCSVCGNESAYNPFGASKFSDYCPNCGAKMDGTPKERGGEK